MKCIFWTNEKLSLIVALSSSVFIYYFKVQSSIGHLAWLFDSGKSIIFRGNSWCPLYFLLYIVNVWVCRLLLPPLISVRDKEEQRDKCHVWQLVSFGLNSLYDTNYSLSPHKSCYYWALRIWEADIFSLFLGKNKDLILWGISFRLWKKKNTALFSKRTWIT